MRAHSLLPCVDLDDITPPAPFARSIFQAYEEPFMLIDPSILFGLGLFVLDMTNSDMTTFVVPAPENVLAVVLFFAARVFSAPPRWVVDLHPVCLSALPPSRAMFGHLVALDLPDNNLTLHLGFAPCRSPMNDLDWMTVNWFLVLGAINFYEGLVFARTCAYRRLCPSSLPS